jgi:hypothetical protein
MSLFCRVSGLAPPHPTTVQPTQYTPVGSSGLSALCGCGRGGVPGVFSCGEYDSCASRGETNRRCLQSLKFFSFLSLAWHDLFEITQTLVNMHSLNSLTHPPAASNWSQMDELVHYLEMTMSENPADRKYVHLPC